MPRGFRTPAVLAALLVAGGPVMTVQSDEGMWLPSDLPDALLRERYGYELTPTFVTKVIYGSVRFPSASGAFVSPQGLLVTNHHVGSDAIQKLSTKDRDLMRDGRAPLLLYGYGSYGMSMPASFSANRLSLVDRGFVYAIAHIRGGKDKGFAWYEDGKMDKKTNTFKDFIAAADYLSEERFTSYANIVAEGGSAGGMLMGAIANMAPEKFGGIIAAVPFVDVLNTMLDDTLPLTPPEWPEWGNPIESKDFYQLMASYSPYDNVEAKAYPAILALSGLTDPRVTYWEPTKWVAKLREKTTGSEPILLKTNMGAGHGGASGRFQRLEEIAFEYAFAIKVAGKM